MKHIARAAVGTSFLFVLLALYNLYLHAMENRLIGEYIAQMQIDPGAFSSDREYLHAISDYVNSDFNTNEREWKHIDLWERPFLRESVSTLLAHKEGLCGEGTRVLVRIFQSLGYDATRIAFAGKNFRTPHALISVQIGGEELIVDSINYTPELNRILKSSNVSTDMLDLVHYRTRLTDREASSRTSEFSEYFEEKFVSYSYAALPYDKFLNALGFNVHLFNYDRPSRAVSYLAESVYLVHAILLLVPALLLLILAVVLRRRSGTVALAEW